MYIKFDGKVGYVINWFVFELSEKVKYIIVNIDVVSVVIYVLEYLELIVDNLI